MSIGLSISSHQLGEISGVEWLSTQMCPDVVWEFLVRFFQSLNYPNLGS